MVIAFICRHFKDDFEQAIVQLSEPLIEASLDLYKWAGFIHADHDHDFKIMVVKMLIAPVTFKSRCVKNDFLPTPEKCHYMFNLRSVSSPSSTIENTLDPSHHHPNTLLDLM